MNEHRMPVVAKGVVVFKVLDTVIRAPVCDKHECSATVCQQTDDLSH